MPAAEISPTDEGPTAELTPTMMRRGARENRSQSEKDIIRLLMDKKNKKKKSEIKLRIRDDYGDNTQPGFEKVEKLKDYEAKLLIKKGPWRRRN